MTVYQTSTNGVVTYFCESIPGEGGSMINTNFRNLANLFSGSQIARALEADYASIAAYAYSVSGGTSASTSQSYGTAANPDLGDSSQLYADDYSHRLLIWGNCSNYQIDCYSNTSGSYLYYPCSTTSLAASSLANVNPFGPFFLKASLVFYQNGSYSSAIFADVEIFGWNLEIKGTRVLRAWSISGASANLQISTDFTANSDATAPTIWVKISNQKLQLSGYPGSEGAGTHTVHARIENVWPSGSDYGSYDSSVS